MPHRWIVIFLAVSLALSYGSTLAQTASGQSTLFRWVDEQGKVHYAENLNDIPERYRTSAVRGTFTPVANSKQPTELKNSGQLEILEDSYYLEEGFYHIKGKVRNGFSQPVSQAKVKVTFFDAEERFIMTESTLVDPIVIPPGKEGRFHLVVKVNPAIDSYKIESIGRP